MSQAFGAGGVGGGRGFLARWDFFSSDIAASNVVHCNHDREAESTRRYRHAHHDRNGRDAAGATQSCHLSVVKERPSLSCVTNMALLRHWVRRSRAKHLSGEAIGDRSQAAPPASPSSRSNPRLKQLRLIRCPRAPPPGEPGPYAPSMLAEAAPPQQPWPRRGWRRTRGGYARLRVFAAQTACTSD